MLLREGVSTEGCRLLWQLLALLVPAQDAKVQRQCASRLAIALAVLQELQYILTSQTSMRTRAVSKARITPKKPRRGKTADQQPAPRWQLQTAKARFSEVFRRARSEGPQWITRQGREAVVMLPAEEFERLTERAKQPRSLAKFFAESPLAKVPINLERTPDYGRMVDL